MCYIIPSELRDDDRLWADRTALITPGKEKLTQLVARYPAPVEWYEEDHHPLQSETHWANAEGGA